LVDKMEAARGAIDRPGATIVSRPWTLASWHREYPGLIAGSVYDAAPSDPASLVSALTAEDVTVHVRVAPRDGMSLPEVRVIARLARPSLVDVHLNGPDDFIDGVLAAVLAVRPARVFLPWMTFTESRADTIRGADVRAWITLRDEWDGEGSDAPWPITPDGVLVMLTEPDAGVFRVDRLAVVTDCIARYPAMPVIAGGDITEAIAPLCVRAGVQQLVVGRALLQGSRRAVPDSAVRVGSTRCMGLAAPWTHDVANARAAQPLNTRKGTL
jgi:hypothetical protein